MRTPEATEAMLTEVFDLLGRGILNPKISQEYALEDAAAAQQAIASRDTTGSIVLIP